jgi:hypothetical protein
MVVAATSAIQEAPTAAVEAARLTRPGIFLVSVESATVFSNRYVNQPKQVSCHGDDLLQLPEHRSS